MCVYDILLLLNKQYTYFILGIKVMNDVKNNDFKLIQKFNC